jgi:hypothetical protein
MRSFAHYESDRVALAQIDERESVLVDGDFLPVTAR